MLLQTSMNVDFSKYQSRMLSSTGIELVFLPGSQLLCAASELLKSRAKISGKLETGQDYQPAAEKQDLLQVQMFSWILHWHECTSHTLGDTEKNWSNLHQLALCALQKKANADVTGVARVPCPIKE